MTTKNDWRLALQEFPDWTPPEGDIPEGFSDQSWHNDVCPVLIGGNVRLWADYADPNCRELSGGRYDVSLYDNDGGHLDDCYSGDDWAAACQIAVAEKLCAQMVNSYPDLNFSTEKARAFDGIGDARVVEFVDAKSGICVADPFGSTCSRFTVDPYQTYGITRADAVRMAAHNFPHGVVHNWKPSDEPTPELADCAQGFHSWIAQRGKLHPDTRCEHCGEKYGNPT